MQLMVEQLQGLLQGFVGGQMELQTCSGVFRGEIATATVKDNNVLNITFEWLVKVIGTYPDMKLKIIGDEYFTTDLSFYSIDDIGPGTKGGNRLYIFSIKYDEAITLIPPDGSRLNPGDFCVISSEG